MSGRLVPLELWTGGKDFVLTPEFEMQIQDNIRKREEARTAQSEFEQENRELSRKLKRQKYSTAYNRLLRRFVNARHARPDLSSREIRRRMGLTQRETDALSRRLKSVGITHRKGIQLKGFRITASNSRRITECRGAT